MPEQLTETRHQCSRAEHSEVLAALSAVARCGHISPASEPQEAVRRFLREHDDSQTVQWLRSVVLKFKPEPPCEVQTPAQLARLKKRCREFDDLLLELRIDTPSGVNERNSVVPPASDLRIRELEPEGVGNAGRLHR